MSRLARKTGKLVALPPPAAPTTRRRHKFIIGFLAAALVAAVGIAIDLTRRASLRPAPLVVVAPVTRGRVVGTVRATGRLAPIEVARVSPSIDGRLTQVLVRPGDEVAKGQVLARFDPLALQAELARAEARAVAAEVASLEAEINVFRRGYPSQGNSERAEQPQLDDGADLGGDEIALARAARAAAEVAATEAAHRLASARLAQGIVRAPAAGVVLERHASEGQSMRAGAPLFLLAVKPATLQIEVAVPEAALGALAVGQEAEFTVPAFPGHRFTGRVQRLLPLPADEATPRQPVVIALTQSDDRLRAGMTANITIRTPSARSVVRVPTAALAFAPRGATRDDEEPALWTVDTTTGRLERRPVEIGTMDGGFAEVRGTGLREGAAVAVGYASAPAAPVR
jgi:HlyD family secretion protein